MRLSTILLLPLGIALASPAPAPVAIAEPEAAPIPTLAARLADSALAANEKAKRQLTVTLLGATAILSNGVLCGGIGPLTGCLGTPGTNVVNGTIRQTSNRIGGTVTGDDFSFLFSIPVPSTTPTATQNVARATEGSRKVALAAGVGALALGLL
jgi:hypothetical protein